MTETLVNEAVVEGVTEGAAMDVVNEVPEILNQPVPTGLGLGAKVGIGIGITVATVGIYFGIKKGIKWFKKRRAAKAEQAQTEEASEETVEANA